MPFIHCDDVIQQVSPAALYPALCQAVLPGAFERGPHSVRFTLPPTKQDYGGVLAQFADSEGGHCSVGEQQRVAES